MKKPLRVLHLEDDPIAAELVRSRLESDGMSCDVTLVDTRAAFISALAGCGFDLILADYSLPGFDGMAALSMALEKCPEVPYIFISGRMGEDIAVEALKKGATDYVLKSSLSRLAPAVKRALRETKERTERKKAEAALLERTRLIEAFFAHTLTPLVFLDRDFNFIRVNEAYARACQRDISEFPGHNHFEFYPSEDLKGKFERVVRTKMPYAVIARPFVFPDHPEWGVTYWDLSLYPILDDRGEVELLVFSLDNVTERKKAEDALRRAGAYNRSLIEASLDPLVTIGPDGKITDVNAATEAVTGCTRDELIGTDFSIYFTEPDNARRGYQQVFQDGVVRDYQLDVRHRDGHTTHVLYNASVYKDESGNVAGVFAAARDITERILAEEENARLEAQFYHAQKLESLGVLAGGIAHDFNNLLTAIMGQVDLAMMKLPLGSAARDQVEVIAKMAESATMLTHQMLAYSGKAVTAKGPINVNVFVHDISEMLKVSVSRRASLKYDFAPGQLYADADAAQLQQVVMNLLTNASDALSEKGGTIKVSTRLAEVDRQFILKNGLDVGFPEGRYVLIEVSDTGVGMDAETRKRIFDPFFTTKFTGRGLGLSAVQGIVRSHGGAIYVESLPDVGTRFTVLLPLVEAPAPAKAASTVKEAPAVHENRAGGTVLVVDDEESVRMVTKKILENFGYKVMVAADGVEGVDVFNTHADNIGLVMLDMTMPRMGGVEAFSEIRRIRSDTPVIFSSGYAEEDVSDQYAEQNRAYFIQKPYNAKKLLDKVAQAFQG